MKILATIVSGIGKFFSGGSKNAATIIEETAELIDKSKFTKEEKSDAQMAGIRLWTAYQKATLPQNLARRLIAVKVVDTWMYLIAASVIGKALGKTDFADYCFDLLTKVVLYAFLAVIFFYFGKGYLDSRNDKKEISK